MMYLITIMLVGVGRNFEKLLITTFLYFRKLEDIRTSLTNKIQKPKFISAIVHAWFIVNHSAISWKI